MPVGVEHESLCQGALGLCAAFHTRTGTVSATTASRKRQVECITLLEQVDSAMAPTSTTMHCVLEKGQRYKVHKCRGFADQHHRAERLMACVPTWKARAHPLQWSTTSVATVMAKGEDPLAKAA
jgi:hypothetical protein